MRNTRRAQRWGLVATVLLAMSVTSYSEAKTSGLVVKMANVSLSQVVTVLAEESGMKVVMETTRDPEVNVNFPNPTPLEEILSNLATPLGLDFWQSGDTYFIGTRPPAVIDPIPVQPVVSETRKLTSPAYVPAPVADTLKQNAIRKVALSYTSANEMCWMLGVENTDIKDPQRKKVMRNRMKSVLEPENPVVNYDSGASYTSPAVNSPWLRGGGNVSRKGSATDGYFALTDRDEGQVGGATYGGMRPTPSGTGSPFGANPFGATAAGATAPGMPGGAARPAGAMPAGNFIGPDGKFDLAKLREAQVQQQQMQQYMSPLGAFIPEGIQTIVGVPGLNSLMIRADSDEAIDQLEQLIKMLDQPVKQAIVELMFVKMSVNESMKFGVKWDINAFPLSITNDLGNTGGTFSMNYVKGNIRAQIASSLTDSKATLVTAPKVLIQNGGFASIDFAESIPYFIVTQADDLAYNSTTTNIEKQMNEYNQGLSVDEFTIHPDNSMSILIDQEFTQPANPVPVPLPDGDGGTTTTADNTASGSLIQYISTRVHIKNGETMLVGAMTNKSEDNGASKTPLLGDLPVIGSLLFKARNKDIKNSETLIFLTATVLEDDTTDFGGISELPPLF